MSLPFQITMQILTPLIWLSIAFSIIAGSITLSWFLELVVGLFMAIYTYTDWID